MKNHGIYVVDDLHTNYGSLKTNYQGVASSTCVEYLNAWLDLRVVDSDEIRDDLEDRGIERVIPPRSSRKTPIDYDRQAYNYKRRNPVEQCVNRLKQFRRIATRSEKDRQSLSVDAIYRLNIALDENCQHGPGSLSYDTLH